LTAAAAHGKHDGLKDRSRHYQKGTFQSAAANVSGFCTSVRPISPQKDVAACCVACPDGGRRYGARQRLGRMEMLGCFHKGGQKVAIVGSFCFVFCFVLLFAERPSKGRDYVVTSAVGVSAKVVIQDLSVQYAIVCISQWNLIFFFLFLWFLADRQTARSGGTSRPCASRALTADSAMMTAPPSCPCAKSNKDPHVMCHGRRDRLPRSRTASGLRIACDSSAVASATLAAPPPSARVCAFTSRSPPVTSTVSYKIISWRQLL